MVSNNTALARLLFEVLIREQDADISLDFGLFEFCQVAVLAHRYEKYLNILIFVVGQIRR